VSLLSQNLPDLSRRFAVCRTGIEIQIKHAYILFNGPQWPETGETMNICRTTRFAGLMVAVLMTIAIHGAMLWKFDAVAHEGELAVNPQLPAIVTLESVNIVASHKS
jgi:hypothetical protein